MSDFSDLGVIGKLVLPSFQKFWACVEVSLGLRDMILRTEAVGVFPILGGHLLIEISA